jgi:hypothetical protein
VKHIQVRIHKSRQDWDHMEERLVPLEQNGDLNLRSIARPEGLVGDCRVSWSSCHEFQSLTGTSAIQVIDPKNRAPLYEYRPGFVLAEDIPRLMQYTYLRLEFVAKKRNKNDVNGCEVRNGI